MQALTQPPDEADTLHELATDKPDLQALNARFAEVLAQLGDDAASRAALNKNTRDCYWPGQTEDGKRHAKKKGEDVFPFDGAADSRVPVVDMFIREDAAKLLLVWKRMKVTVAGTESGDAEFATRMTQLLRWMKHTQMRECRREMRLLANWLLERGTAVLGVFWEKVTQLGYQTVTLEELADTTKGGSPELVQMVQDPTLEDLAIPRAQEKFPNLSPKRIRKVLKDLRETGRAEFPEPYVVRNRPTMVALMPGEDIFWSKSVTDLNEAPEIYRIEALTEAQLRERAVGAGYDPKWVDNVVENFRGQQPQSVRGVTRPSTATGLQRRGLGSDSSQLYYIIHCYARRADEDGVPGIFYTVFHQNDQDRAGWHGLLNYEHGEQPFTLFETESRSRLLDDARGYGERAHTLQQAIKVQWDARTDRTSVSTFPPMFHPPNLPPERWGPGVKIGTNRKEQYGFAEIPEYDRGSEEIESKAWAFVHRYFGRPVDELNVAEAQAVQQELAENFMAACMEVDTQILKLCQQRLPEVFYYRVVGSQKAQTIKATRNEIQGAFDISVSYSMADLVPEMVQEKLKLVQEMLAWDTGGTIDRNDILQYGFELLDPNLGERVLRPAGEAAQAELDDEDAVFSKIFAGIPVDVRPGQNYELRKQRLEQNLQQNPVAMQRAKTDLKFKQDLEQRIKQLSHQIEQKENALIGRLGA